MATGSCRRCGRRPRRMRGGKLEPLCERCRREALDKVAGELATEAGRDGRARLPRAGLRPAGRPADLPPERVAPVARVGARQLGRARRGPRPRVGDELLREARRLYALGLSLRAVAETLLAETGYASVDSAEVALRAQFKRRGWPLRNRAQPSGRGRRGGATRRHARPERRLQASSQRERRPAGAFSTDQGATMQMQVMAIETPTGTRLAPEPESPFWRDADGERLSYQDVVAGLAGDAAGEAAERHADAVGAVAREAALARLRGEAAAARRLALAASRLCEEIAGFWPRDSWKPIR